MPCNYKYDPCPSLVIDASWPTSGPLMRCGFLGVATGFLAVISCHFKKINKYEQWVEKITDPDEAYESLIHNCERETNA